MKPSIVGRVERAWASASSLGQLDAAGFRVAEEVGARTYTACLYLSPMDKPPVLHLGLGLDGLQGAGIPEALFSRQRALADSHCADSALPVVWGAWGVRVVGGEGPGLTSSDFMCVQMALHVNPSHHFGLAFHWTTPYHPCAAEQLQGALHWLHINCLHAERAASRLVKRGPLGVGQPVLSSLQVQLLGWLAKGMPEHLLPMLLSLERADVDALRRSTVQAMGSANETEAVIRAAALGVMPLCDLA